MHRITKKVVYSLPISETIKALLIKKLSKIIPIEILLRKVRLPNPISFNEMTLTIPINTPNELTTLLSIAENRNLNLLGMIKKQ